MSLHSPVSVICCDVVPFHIHAGFGCTSSQSHRAEGKGGVLTYTFAIGLIAEPRAVVILFSIGFSPHQWNPADNWAGGGGSTSC